MKKRFSEICIQCPYLGFLVIFKYKEKHTKSKHEALMNIQRKINFKTIKKVDLLVLILS
jgi:hypothetical protein